ncbi:MAG: Amidase [Burkholderiales bacterium]|jgi:aspartyl-tRNA(Asn)/glutamyl-tRNA(Gln) amidotransferase subunit A|nr:Amidase [Burkholderiales bacterium]
MEKHQLKSYLLSPLLTLFFFTSLAQANQIDEYKSINEIHNAIITHQSTCHEIIKSYLARVYKYNLSLANNKPPLNAISQINVDLLNQANNLDKSYTKNNKLSGSLFCVPVVVKDNIDVLGMETASGSYALLGSRPLNDAVLVDQLKKEGAIIIAKAGMDELAMGASGISSLDGRIGNAYDVTMNPGGSSGGTAAAIAANFAIIGIGTDNSGSVRLPAAFNGLYGLRPTQGLISKNGVFPMGNIDGTPGPMTKTVTDLAISLNAITKNGIDYTKYLNSGALSGKVIAVLNTAGNYDVWKHMPQNIKNIYTEATQNLIKSGAKIKYLSLPKFDNNRSPHMAGTAEDVNDYLQHNLTTRSSMQDMCRSDNMRVIGSKLECLKDVNSIPKKGSAKYKEALAIISYNLQYVTKIMKKDHIDGILLPISKSGSSTYALTQVNTWQAPVSSNTGLPSIVIQIGHNKDNMPIAMEIVGNKLAEGKLLSMAYDYEQHYTAYVPPTLTSSSEFDDWPIAKLNNLFRQIGKDTYQLVIKPKNKNEVTPQQSYTATVQAIKDVK